MSSPTTCFFAYPGRPLAVAEAIETAIDAINEHGRDAVHIKGWKTLNVTGKFIVDEICAAIRTADVFICDLTYPNPNVLFELGYAVICNKRIWITLDDSHEAAKTNYEKLRLVTTMGYAEYHHAQQLERRFFQEAPYTDLSSTVYNNVIKSIAPSSDASPSLLYLKSEIETEASVRLTRRLSESPVSVVTDDPREINSQPLAWYARNVYLACGVVVHLLDEERDSKLLHNAKYSFVAGMAFGADKPLLMLAPSPFHPPLDYQDTLYIHETASACISAVDVWLPKVESAYSADRQARLERSRELGHEVALKRIALGEDIAENEQQTLGDYFVVTNAYEEMRRNPQSMIYVGRKGTGKTANLFRLADDLARSNPNNHICTIKPASYELEGVLALLRLSTDKAQQGYLIESLWKFLVYTELAVSAYDLLQSKPVHYVRTSAENELISYVEEHAELIKAEFAVRLERAVRDLCGVEATSSIEQQRARVSEVLHSTLLVSLREILGRALEKKPLVCILVDNLDKAWMRGAELGLLSDFLFGLLSVARVISDEYRKRGVTWRPVNISLIVFLRSDIFSHIMREARERDKLGFRRLDWSDPLLLQRVIEQRFLRSVARPTSPNQVWEELFVPSVKGITTKAYLVNRVIPRPRDIIYLCKAALARALSRGHAMIEESDILLAEKEYSQYAFNSLEAETSTELPGIENLLYEFAGADEIVTRDQIQGFVRKAGIDETATDRILELLCETTFLGLEIEPGRFEYLYDENRSKVAKTLARKTAEMSGQERFVVNPPFHAYLEICPTQ